MHHDIHLGITGLRRTGKTVFLTALIYQLEQLGSQGLNAFANRGVRLETAEILGNDGNNGLAKLPYEETLGRLRTSACAAWPNSTDSESGLVLKIPFRANAYRRLGKILRMPLGLLRDRGSIRLFLHDYPGEFLLDTPLAKYSYGSWSSTALDRMAGQCPDRAAAYHKELEQIFSTSDDADDTRLARQLAEVRNAYGRYLAAARSAGMEMLQPGMTLASLKEPIQNIAAWTADLLPFAPLSNAVPDDHPAKLDFAKRFDAYVKERVAPFIKRLRRSSRQIVLVDVLRVLHNGVQCFNDTQQCLATIIGAYRYNGELRQIGQGLPRSLRPPSFVSRVIFAATKADHAVKSHRANLGRLLEILVQRARSRCAAGPVPIKYEWFTSLRATADCRVPWNDRPAEALYGRLIDDAEAKVRNPGVVPNEWPTGGDDDPWPFESERFVFPHFAPRSLPPRDLVPWPHINLDSVLWESLADCFYVQTS